MTSTSAAHPPRLLTNGTIHSPSEPYADAMLVEDGLIAWVGSDETAAERRDPDLVIHDLDRALVTPAFVGWVELTDPDAADPAAPGSAEHTPWSERVTAALDEAAAQGCGAVRLSFELSSSALSDADAAQESLNAAFRAAAEHGVRAYPVLALTGLDELSVADRLDAVRASSELLRTVDAILDRPAALELPAEEILEQLLGIRLAAAQAQRQLILRVDQDTTASTVVTALVDTTAEMRSKRQSPPGGLPTVLHGFDSASREDWESLLNTGVQVVLRGAGHLATALSVGVPVSAVAEAGQRPWSTVSAHVHHPSDPVSVRAGFNAQTRGAYRSLPESSGTPVTSAQLDPGARASYAIWEVDSLAVQTPDSRTAAWSTDVRARTPLLPYLDGQSLPRLISTVIDGVEVAPSDPRAEPASRR
ncbi:hypothetical protein [Nesterenkonia jeotgali]|uniref:Amidohydrolase 3 domain-containing protein n=1 Tax=Nesterenkonia jeotgali TaxID=317018 RepID=A0A0W8IDF2_9MICC|nr:hypothetical protein [Nesterenkonia jeotgali]KUG57957.1 hypothetical protein AVL63_05485 [Nesterenkonia jeotgali]